MDAKDRIQLAHGNGGRLTHELIAGVFLPVFGKGSQHGLTDGAILPGEGGRWAMTTDSHVVTPLFFPGGDIGTLSVFGTVNDLAVMGAEPRYLSCGFILEEGLELSVLKRVVHSIGEAAKIAGVRIVTGDTKVVEKGAVDQLFINTTGLGQMLDGSPTGVEELVEGDAVILSGTIGDHGTAIYAGREGIGLGTDLVSDCACIAPLANIVMQACRGSSGVRVMRDPTRGGVATTLNEFLHDRTAKDLGIELDESQVAVREEVRGVCELLGFDPLYLANEGKLLAVVPAALRETVVSKLREHPLGREASCIGRLTRKYGGRVTLKTVIGGERVVDMLVGDMLPRIC